MRRARAARPRRRCHRGAGATIVSPLAHLLFEPPLGGAAGPKLPLLASKLHPRLFELLFHLRPAEIAAERRVRHVIIAGQIAQRFARRPTPNQRLVDNEPAQATATFHPSILALELTHHERTKPR